MNPDREPCREPARITFTSPHLPEDVSEILLAALDAANPAKAVHAHVHRNGHLLIVEGRTYDLEDYRRVYVIGGGKASSPMAAALEEILAEHLDSGIVNVKYCHKTPTEVVDIHQAGHNPPDQNGVDGTDRMLELIHQATEQDLVFCVISGGGSDLIIRPAGNIIVNDIESMTKLYERSGIPIRQVNTVRKHLDQVKGGGLVRFIHPARTVSLILSDVVGDPLDVIASGPTVRDPTTFEDARAILDRYKLWEEAPPSVVKYLREGPSDRNPETPKPGDPIFENVQNVIVGSNTIAAEAAAQRAAALGFNKQILTTYLEGEAREVGRVMAAIARELVEKNRPLRRPACIIAGGETTVTVRGSGTGGRNQEMALSAAIGIAGLDNVLIACLATDGDDARTGAAGAVVDGSTVARAQALGLDPIAHLDNNDSHSFFAKTGDLLICGPTNTNVNDLTFIFAW